LIALFTAFLKLFPGVVAHVRVAFGLFCFAIDDKSAVLYLLVFVERGQNPGIGFGGYRGTLCFEAFAGCVGLGARLLGLAQVRDFYFIYTVVLGLRKAKGFAQAIYLHFGVFLGRGFAGIGFLGRAIASGSGNRLRVGGEADGAKEKENERSGGK